MKFAFHTFVVSPHQLPLADALVDKLGNNEFRYIAHEPLSRERLSMGWGAQGATWCLDENEDGLESCRWLRGADILFSYLRTTKLFGYRAKERRRTYYSSERWFRPFKHLPGLARLLDPRYFKMAFQMTRLIADGAVMCLPMGCWAAVDVVRLMLLFKGHLKMLISEPRLTYERVPYGRVFWLGQEVANVRMWGYFVAPSAQQPNNRTIEQSNNLKVLWVGRMIPCKRVDTIIRAVCEVEKRGRDGQRTIQLTLVGDGPEKSRLQALANRTIKQSNNQTITFLPSQPIDKIRNIMREHDVFVFASNAIEGWGAVVSEALEEGMTVIGTYEAGSSATILSEEWLFHAGDWRRLSKLLAWCVEMKAAGTLHGQGIGEWSAQNAAARLLELIA